MSSQRFFLVSENYFGEHLFVLPGSFKHLSAICSSGRIMKWVLCPQPGLFAQAHDVKVLASTFAFLMNLTLDEIIGRGLWHSANTFFQ